MCWFGHVDKEWGRYVRWGVGAYKAWDLAFMFGAQGELVDVNRKLWRIKILLPIKPNNMVGQNFGKS